MSGCVFLIFCVLLCCLLHSCRCNDHFENVALNKPCNMSSIHDSKSHPVNAAVNGNTAMKYTTTNCVHSGWSGTSQWWEVNLGRKYPVHGMSVWPREEFGQRMSNSVITVDGEMCYKFQKVPSNIDREIAINCTGGVMNGSVVRLARSGTAGYEDSYLINMCEFQVFSCSARYWGSDCGQVCGNCRNGTCDKVTGHCDSGCQPRWKSPLCAGCSARYWGSDCGQECGNCRNGTCDKVTGHCDSGCQPGWKSPLCAGCSARYWGSDCGQECGNCRNGTCDKVTGHCDSGCQPGWKSPLCAGCSARYWGSDCGQECGNCRNGTCDKVTGHCDSGCQPGWKSPLCAECGDGIYGQDCTQNCSENCASRTCGKVSGNCTCKPGWMPPDCSKGCSNVSFGQHCSQNCSQNCADVCDKVTGYCTCNAGWKPPNCTEECGQETYGQNCSQSCSKNCTSGPCDKVSGHCTCNPGWMPPNCSQECSEGHFGQNCTETCSCEHGTCDKVSGSCTCETGRMQPNCSEEIIPGSSTPDPVGAGEGGAAANTGEGPPTAVIVGSAAGGVLAVVLVVSVVIFLIRRRHSQMEPDEVNVVERHGTVSDHNNPVFQNVCDPDNGPVCTPDTPEEAHTRPTAVVKPKQMAAPRPKPRPSQRGHMYENVGVNGEVYPGPSRHSTANMADTETGDDGDALDTSDDTRAAYYNDPVYMTSQAATLGLDRVQQYLLDKLRADTLDDEFENLPYGHKRDHEVGSKEENRPKNRFNNSILPYDATRVVLQGNRDPDSSDYINASYIKGFSNKTYIGAQGPKTTSVCDFWRMVWQEKITHIVMLTNLAEAGKNKCVQYWPRKGKHCKYSSVDVTGLDVEERADCVIRTFDVKRSGGGASRHVTQYHYVTWPDHSVPTASALVEFWRTVTISHRNQQSPSPLLVHCSAGVGRTGTFIALDIAMDAAQNESKIDIFAIIQRMREDRMNMVQTKSQYRFVHEAILEAYTSRHTRLVLHAFNSVFPLAIDPMKTNDRIDSEFKLLNQMKVLLHKPSHTVAEDEENIGKNRTLDILPDDSHLACLSSPVSGRNQYINAVFLSTFFSRLGCIMTQLPLYHTLVDIWRLVDGNDVTTIVSLGAEVEGLEAECCYWPRQEGQSKEFGPFTVTLSSKAILGEHLTSYMLSLQSQNHSYDREVYVLQYSGWTYEVPNSTPDILHLVDLVNARARRTIDDDDDDDEVDNKVIVQCFDSATKSGLFRAICDVISRMTFDRDVDVYMAVRHVQIARPESVASLVQYRYLYHVIQEYQKRNAVYNNA